MPHSWSYTKERGPNTWANQYPAAGGEKQSPVDIPSSSAQDDADLKDRPLFVDYDPYKCKMIANPGYCWRVDVDGKESVLQGGPLEHKYELKQFHFHWGKTDKTGSEHTVDGKSYPAELHLVHWNTDLYKDFNDAVAKENGLAVLGTFIEIGEEHAELKKLTDLLSNVKHKGDETAISDGFDPTTLLPENRSYWTYDGSLTTPPCYETVTWIVFKNSIQISADQIAKFRELCSYCRDESCPEDEFEGLIVDNFRPPLPLGKRILRHCDAN